MEIRMRVALCQIETHPAFSLDDIAPMCEPFIATSNLSLCNLSRQAINVHSLRTHCKKRYLSWHTQRIQKILAYLNSLTPCPDIIIFPEGSIPFDCLQIMRQHAIATGATIFAGTHSYQHNQNDAYKGMGFTRLYQAMKDKARNQQTILPIFNCSETYYHTKQSLSPFERSDVDYGSSRGQSEIKPIKLRVGKHDYKVLPLVCADMLQYVGSTNNTFDFAVVCAYQSDHVRFEPIMSHFASNQIPTFFCNDGKYGGSRIAWNFDERCSLWWKTGEAKGQLPIGDSILVADIDMSKRGIEVGVSETHAAFSLVRLSDISYKIGISKKYSKSLEFRGLKSAGIDNIQTRLGKISQSNDSLSKLQIIKQNFMVDMSLSSGIDIKWSDVLLDDCIIDDLPDIRTIESSLAGECAQQLEPCIFSEATPADSLKFLTRYITKCKEVAGATLGDSPRHTPDNNQNRVVFDRDDESSSIRSFLRSREEQVLILFGLREIGKSVALSKAIQEIGQMKILSINIDKNTSLAFVISTILRFHSHETSITFDPDCDLTSNNALNDAIKSIDCIIFSNSDNFFESRDWRSASLKQGLHQLVTLIFSTTCKAIFESKFSISLDIDSRKVRRLRIEGLMETHATALFDYHLNRVGLNPTNYLDAEKQEVIKRLSGHPGELILATDYIYRNTIENLLRDLRSHSKFYREIVNRLVSGLHLSSDEHSIICLLTHCRAPIPPFAISKALGIDAMALICSLIDMSIVRREENDFIRLIGLLEGYDNVGELAPETLLKLHGTLSDEYLKLSALGNSELHLRWAVAAQFHLAQSGTRIPLDKHEQIIDGYFAAANSLLKVGDARRASTIFATLLPITSDPEILSRAAVSFARAGDCDRAFEIIEKAVNSDRTFLRELIEVGIASLYCSKQHITEKVIAKAKSICGETSQVLTLEGQSKLKGKQFIDAIEILKKALGNTEHYAWPYFYLGKAYIRAGQPMEAVKVLEDGIDFIENNGIRNKKVLSAINTQLGLAYFHSGDISGAEKVLHHLMSYERGIPEVIGAYALIKVLNNQSMLADNAIRELEKMPIKSHYDRCHYHLYRGIFYLQTKRESKASEEFSKAHQSDPANVFVMIKWARTLFMLAEESLEYDERDIALQWADQCKYVIAKILAFDSKHSEAISIQQDLFSRFKIQ